MNVSFFEQFVNLDMENVVPKTDIKVKAPPSNAKSVAPKRAKC